MENLITINAESRKETGKKFCKNLRQQDKLPAIIYGGKAQSLAIAVEMKEIRKILKSESGENSILRIIQDNKEKTDAMIKEIQYDFLSKHIIHVDFVRIDLDKPVEVQVPIVLHGDPIGVRLEDGILDFVNRDVTVKCLPTRIPREIAIEITDLHVNHSIKVENLPVFEEVQYVSHPNSVICSVVVKAKEKVEEVAAEAAPEAVVEGEAAAAAPAAPGADKAEKPEKPGKEPEAPAAKKGEKKGD